MREIKSQISSLMNKIDCEPNNVTSGMGQSHCSRVLNFDNKENKAKNGHNSNQNAMISEIDEEKSGLLGYEGNEGLSPISLQEDVEKVGQVRPRGYSKNRERQFEQTNSPKNETLKSQKSENVKANQADH